jgi:hypothetical protein
MPAASDIRDDLLGLLGLESIDHAPPGTSARMLSDLNGALQQINTLAPDSFFSQEPLGFLVRAPTTVTVSVTAQSQAITITGWAAWMAGCTIVIAGDANQNVILTSASASKTLLKPYMGSTNAAASAIVYQDVIAPGDNVKQIIAPVMVEGYWELVPVPHERHRQIFDASAMNGLSPAIYPLLFSRRPIQVPTGYLIENQATYLGYRNPVLRLSSLPDQNLVVSMGVEQTAPHITGWDDTRTWLVPYGYSDSILKPIVRYKFASWPHFTGNKSDLKDDYDAALAILDSLKPRGYVESHIGCASDFS